MALMTHREANQVKWMGSRPAHNGTQILKDAFGSLVGNPVHTVTAGKTFYLNAITWNVYATALTLYYVRIRNAVPAVVNNLVRGYLPVAGITSAGSLSFPVPLELIEDWSIFVETDNVNGVIYCFVHGWEE